MTPSPKLIKQPITVIDAEILPDEESGKEFDTGRIFGIIILIILFAGIFYGSYQAITYVSSMKYREQCEKNPLLRYSQSCSSYEECVDKCIEKLREEKVI